MILLDTNICIYIINAKPPQVLACFHRFRLGEVGISCVVGAELAYGVAKRASARNRSALEMFLAPLEIMSFDENAVWTNGTLRADLEHLGQIMGALGIIIAAHALSLDATLVANNQREFSRVIGLRLDNWID
jgi:tRNA(fMet)-specific endonuclease VapC